MGDAVARAKQNNTIRNRYKAVKEKIVESQGTPLS
jgi:hypothetical protein